MLGRLGIALAVGWLEMRTVRAQSPVDDAPEPSQGTVGGAAQSGGRLNLLLSWGGWRPDSWADSMECLLRPMGVQSMRARTARQAEQVIRSSPIHIAVVDLGLPLDVPADQTGCEEAGCRILDLLRRLPSPPPTVIVRSTRASREAARDLSAALRFNAFAVVDRTSADVELMLKVLQRCLDRCYHGRWPCSDTPPAPPR